MNRAFFDRPILNSPYQIPAHHWELDANGQPTQNIALSRRRAEFVTPIPKPKKQRGGGKQGALILDEHSTQEREYAHTALINDVRAAVDKWRALPDPGRERPVLGAEGDIEGRGRRGGLGDAAQRTSPLFAKPTSGRTRRR